MYLYSPERVQHIVVLMICVSCNCAFVPDDYGYSVLLGYVLELLTFCVEKHTYHIKNYIMRQDLLGRALVLLQSHHTHLVLGMYLSIALACGIVPYNEDTISYNVCCCCPAGLRFCRRIVGLQDEFYNRYLVRGDHFTPVVALFQRNSSRYNLINSAIIEIFEFIKQVAYSNVASVIINLLLLIPLAKYQITCCLLC